MGHTLLRGKPLGEPLNKAEDTFIGTLANKRGGLFTKQHAQILINAFLNNHLMLLLLAIIANHQFLIGNVETIIDQVADHVPIDGANEIPWL